MFSKSKENIYIELCSSKYLSTFKDNGDDGMVLAELRSSFCHSQLLI